MEIRFDISKKKEAEIVANLIASIYQVEPKTAKPAPAPAPESVKTPAPAPTPQPAPAVQSAPAPAAAPAPATAPPVTEVTYESLVAMVREKFADNLQPVIDMLAKVGAGKLSEIPPEKLQEAHAILTAA